MSVVRYVTVCGITHIFYSILQTYLVFVLQSCDVKYANMSVHYLVIPPEVAVYFTEFQ